jgi:hypothetical protein
VARADDYVSVRGAYYREPSTRVIQPMVEIERDSPGGIDVTAHYLVDTITSASASAGVGTDALFTEIRNEVGLSLRKRWERTDVSVGYKYSAESDYWSHSWGASVGHRFWGDTARLSLSLGQNFDVASSRTRPTPACATAPATSCSMQGYYAGLTYTQVISPVLLGQLSAESVFLDGFQGNIYRTVPNLGYERLPDRRLRTAISPRIAYYIPRSGTGLQFQYRYYRDFWPGNSPTGSDPWHMNGHMFELRVYQTLTRDLEVRLSYRQYLQDDADFWCNTMADTACYLGRQGPQTMWFSSDPKLGSLHTEYPEAKLYWTATAFADVPVLRWFAAGTFEISYGRYFQSTSFQNAHVLQAGYTMPY